MWSIHARIRIAGVRLIRTDGARSDPALCGHGTRAALGPEAPRDDPLGVDTDHGLGRFDYLGPAANLNSAGSPRVRAREIVDDQRRAAAPSDVAKLLRLREFASAD